MNETPKSLLSDELEASLSEIKQNLDHNLMNPVTSAMTPELQKSANLRSKMDQFKMEVSKEIGLDKELDSVGGDAGLLTPMHFGHLGGQMSGRLTAQGKDIYRRMRNEYKK